MIVATQNTAEEEQVLAARVTDGDERAFGILFERYGPRIYRYCCLMAGRRTDAEDAYQDTFIAFWSACRRGGRMTNVYGYLITVARTQCLDRLKLQRRNTPLEDHLEPSCEPDVAAIDTEDVVHRALLRLPAQYREAIVLSEYDGYSYQEIAEILAVTRHVVKNRIHRAKQLLRKHLSPFMNGDNDLEELNG